MAFDRFLIAPLNEGLETDLKPWVIPESAFAQLDNAYIFRGRVRKRFGGQLMGSGWPSVALAPLFSRFRITLTGGSGVGITNGAGLATGTVPGLKFKVGQLFSIGTAIYTVTNSAGGAQAMLQTVATTTATFNLSNGTYSFNGAPATTQIYFYPAEPVMGLTNYEVGAVNNQPSYGFDTQFAYVFAGGFWQRSSNAALVPLWHGTNSDFFWVANWQGITANLQSLFVSNFFVTNPTASGTVLDDPLWTFDGTTWKPFSYLPNLTANPGNVQPITVTSTKTNGTIINNYVQTAKIVLPFKDRLILLNTVENNANGATQFNSGSATTTGITPTNYATSTNSTFAQRCRYSHNGSPFAPNAWLEPNQIYFPDAATPATSVAADGGGFVDAPTEEQIISAEFIKDRLIVYFERSTWELAYTQNQVLPFVWQKINTELGSEAMLSSVPFDKVVLTIGTTGVHACTGANVERVDDKIPDQVFQIRNSNDGIDRVAGIRDYATEMVYWTFPIDDAPSASAVYPTKVLVYNYKNGAWALNDDCITAWGYFEQQLGKTWANSIESWQTASFAWNSGSIQPDYRQVIAGNQQGFVFIVDPEEPRNAPVMQITNMVGPTLTIIDHSLNLEDYIAIENGLGSTNLNGMIVQVIGLVDANTVTVDAISTGTYTGQATAARVSNLGIASKQWNPYVDKDRGFHLQKIDFLVDRTANGAVQVDYFPSSTNLSMIASGEATGSALGNNILETSPYSLFNTLEDQQDRLWHSVYFQTQGSGIQIYISMTDDQMRDPLITWSEFQLHALTLYARATSSRLE